MTAQQRSGYEGRLLTQREVATLYGVTRARVQQLEAMALRKLKLGILDDPELRDYVEERFGVDRR